MKFPDLKRKPLPKEQQVTEASLINLERTIAQKVKKNEEMLMRSEILAQKNYIL